MLRKLLVLGIFMAVAAASVPAFYERNPDAFGALLRPFLADKRDERLSPSPSPSPSTIARAEVAPTTEVLLGRKVRIPADPHGHYRADFKLNGRSLTALVDTGATYVAINRSTARRIGLKLSPADFRYQVNTANGATGAAAVTIDSLQIGRIHVDEVEAVVLDDKALDGSLVGLSFLNRLASFRMESGSLLLEQ